MTRRNWTDIKRDLGVPDDYRSPLLERCRHGEPVFVCRSCTLVDVPPDPDPEPVTGTTRWGWFPVVLVVALAVVAVAWRITR